MKKFTQTASLALTAALLATAAHAAPEITPRASERVEIPVESVFAPYQGFDDNDQIDLVIHGTLPNACYQLADSFYEHKEDGSAISVRQFAIRRNDGICAQGAEIPPHMQMAVPFTREMSIGRLHAADYQLEYKGTSGGRKIRSLNVSKATNGTVDSLPYAVVSNATIPDVVDSKGDTAVVLNGVLNSSCTELDDEVKVIKDRDVYVVLPTVKVKPGMYCLQVLIPFEKRIELGQLSEGEYLVHVRSMNGKSVNRVVHSVDAPTVR